MLVTDHPKNMFQPRSASMQVSHTIAPRPISFHQALQYTIYNPFLHILGTVYIVHALSLCHMQQTCHTHFITSLCHLPYHFIHSLCHEMPYLLRLLHLLALPMCSRPVTPTLYNHCCEGSCHTHFIHSIHSLCHEMHVHLPHLLYLLTPPMRRRPATPTSSTGSVMCS